MTQNTQTVNGQKLYMTAAALLGKPVAPKDASTNYGVFGCALTMNGIAERAWGHPIGGGASTQAMYAFLQNTTKYAPVLPGNELPGDIIISPTGSGANPAAHGHVGCIAKYGILSNNSEDGNLEEQWTLETWRQYFGTSLGFPVLVYRPL